MQIINTKHDYFYCFVSLSNRINLCFSVSIPKVTSEPCHDTIDVQTMQIRGILNKTCISCLWKSFFFLSRCHPVGRIVNKISCWIYILRAEIQMLDINWIRVLYCLFPPSLFSAYLFSVERTKMSDFDRWLISIFVVLWMDIYVYMVLFAFINIIKMIIISHRCRSLFIFLRFHIFT